MPYLASTRTGIVAYRLCKPAIKTGCGLAAASESTVLDAFSSRCKVEDILLEVDRILRPEGSIIFRDDVDVLVKVKNIIDGMDYSTRIVDHEKGPHEREKILLASKLYWTAPEEKHGETQIDS